MCDICVDKVSMAIANLNPGQVISKTLAPTFFTTCFNEEKPFL